MARFDFGKCLPAADVLAALPELLQAAVLQLIGAVPAFGWTVRARSAAPDAPSPIGWAVQATRNGHTAAGILLQRLVPQCSTDVRARARACMQAFLSDTQLFDHSAAELDIWLVAAAAFPALHVLLDAALCKVCIRHMSPSHRCSWLPIRFRSWTKPRGSACRPSVRQHWPWRRSRMHVLAAM